MNHIAGGQKMKTMELDSKRAMLAREILNTEDVELLKELIMQLNEYKAGKIQARPLDELIKEIKEEEKNVRNI